MQASLPTPVRYEAASSSALLFDPPVTLGQPPLALSREGRSVEAFMGYESLSATYFYQYTEDRQYMPFDSRFGTFDRRSVSAKVGVSYR